MRWRSQAKVRRSGLLAVVVLVVLLAVAPMACAGDSAESGPPDAPGGTAATALPDDGGDQGEGTPVSGAAVSATRDSTAAQEPAAAGGPVAGAMPPELIGVPLGAWVGGDQARFEVEQLHGKTLGEGMDEAWVAQYGTGEATVWLTRAVRPEDARDLYARMVDRIATGDSPFTPQEPIEIPGVEGYALSGLGQQHYYFLVDGDLYWLAVDAGSATAALEELVAHAAAIVEAE